LKCLRGRRDNHYDDEVRRVFLGQAEPNSKRSLLPIRSLESHGFFAISPNATHLIWPKANPLDDPILLIFGVDWREIAWLSLPSLVLEKSLQPGNLLSITFTHKILQLVGHHRLYANRFAKSLGSLRNLQFHVEIGTNWFLGWWSAGYR